VEQSFLVQYLAQTVNFPAIAAQTAGTMLNLSATASSGLTVNFASVTPSVCTVSVSTASLNAYGTCIIQATQAGNTVYSAAHFASQGFLVQHEAQTINFPAIAAQTAGTMLNLSASASSGLTVNFASVTPSVCTVSVSTASLNAYGTCIIQATQAGNNVYGAAHYVNQGFLVQHETQTINFPAIAAQTAGTMLNLSATASSGQAVSFGSQTPTICSVSSTTASMLKAGTCTIVATQSGNGVYGAAAPVLRSFTVKP
jgi:hypothetical protein